MGFFLFSFLHSQQASKLKIQALQVQQAKRLSEKEICPKNLKMIFEVHDYKENDGQVYWCMRFYDDDKNKNFKKN